MKAITTVVTGKNTRFSYLNANEPKAPMDGRGTPKYSASLIIPKSDTVTVAKIQTAIKAAYDEGQGKLRGNGKVVPKLEQIHTPLRDGDEERPGDKAYARTAGSSIAPAPASRRHSMRTAMRSSTVPSSTAASMARP